MPSASRELGAVLFFRIWHLVPRSTQWRSTIHLHSERFPYLKGKKGRTMNCKSSSSAAALTRPRRNSRKSMANSRPSSATLLASWKPLATRTHSSTLSSGTRYLRGQKACGSSSSLPRTICSLRRTKITKIPSRQPYLTSWNKYQSCATKTSSTSLIQFSQCLRKSIRATLNSAC